MVGFPFFILTRAASYISPNQNGMIIAYGKGEGKVKLSLYLTN
jgi:hypothetical protein